MDARALLLGFPGFVRPWIPPLAGLSLTLLVQTAVVPLVVKVVKRKTRLVAPEGMSATTWSEIASTPKSGGRWVGFPESIVCFVAFWMGKPELIAGWLLFKVGSKWQVWSTVIRIPEKLNSRYVDDLGFLKAKHLWGNQLLQAFLAGTLWNILAGLVGASAARFCCDWMHYLLRQ